MELNLKRDLCFFDIESTGLNVIKDRILQIAIIKVKADGSIQQELSMLINPGIPISEEAMRIHGITPKDLANKPVFEQVAAQIFDFIGNSDLAGYNCHRFDVPMLMEEFARVGYDFSIDNRKVIDVQRIFYKMEPRTLKAAVKFYCNKDLLDAHDALNDVRATLDVLKGQLDMYNGKMLLDDEGNETTIAVENDINKLHEFTNDLKTIDGTQRLKYNEKGEIVFNFGKYTNQTVKNVFKEDKNYFHWIQKMEFSHQVKKIVKNIFDEMYQK